MRSYNAARRQFDGMELLAKLIMLFGAVIAATAAYGVSEFSGQNIIATAMAALPGLGIAAVGLFVQVHAQTSRAAVDSAEYAQQALKVARDQFELSKEMFAYEKARAPVPARFSETPPADISIDTEATRTAPPGAPTTTTRHFGRIIQHAADGYYVDGLRFPSLDEAKSSISEDLGKAMQPLVARRDHI